MEIGIISDTHGFLDPQVLECFENCDEIWHAGDFGSIEVAERLEQFKPLRGVFGNIDDDAIRDRYPEQLRFECGQVDILMIHIAGRPGRYESKVKKLLQQDQPQVLVCGHSHILHVENDSDHNGMRYINPGAAGHQGLHTVRTLLKCTIKNQKLGNTRVIELGPRGRSQQPRFEI